MMPLTLFAAIRLPACESCSCH